MAVSAEERFGRVVPVLFANVSRIVKAVDKRFGAEGRCAEAGFG